MKKITKIKAMLLALLMLLGLIAPVTATAQSDGFFRGGYDNYDYRDASIDDGTGGIQNDGFGVPVGSGLLILTAVGAGYAISRRKRNFKKGTTLLLAALMLIGMTDCKKKQAEPQNVVANQVNITLDAGGNSGSKYTINTSTGAVDFQDGDVIYVGDGSHYIGTLTRTDGKFSGNINEPADNTEIYFYFVGNLTPSTTPSPGSTSSFTVDISDQSSQMPVLSCNYVTYYTGVSSYSCKLQNKCALVKFTTSSTSAPVHVGGLYTEAKIDFANNSITNNGTTGFIALKSASTTEKWAVLLPQTSFSGAECVIADQGYTISMPAIEADAFLTGDAAISFGSTSSHHRYLQWAAGNLELKDGDHVYGTLSGNYKVTIENKVGGATVTLDNVTINGVNEYSYGWAGITCLGDATIILADGTTNTVKGFYNRYPGIHVPSGSTLIIQGTGTLNASSNGMGAGIGAGRSIACGNIIINSGTITATGGTDAAGIGCSNGASCGTISITGGTVEARGGMNGAGVGGSTDTSCGNITISGGTVTATGGSSGAGIGSGCRQSSSSSCGIITISGGTVTATGGGGSAGIGCGANASCGDITIENTVTIVTATKGVEATNSVGKGYGGSCGTVTIGGEVGAITTSPYTYVPALDLSTVTSDITVTQSRVITGTLGTKAKISIADGVNVTLKNVNINGSNTWTDGRYPGISCLGDVTITLEGTNVVKGLNSSYPGLNVVNGKTLTIRGSGSLNAIGGWGAAGIGAGWGVHCGNIRIEGGTITASSSAYASAIGGGVSGNCGNITITGGSVSATGGGESSGIGTGKSNCGNILISGGTVSATGGSSGAGIGTSNSSASTCGTITITIGVTKVTATKGSGATNSIGQGIYGTCGTITIGGVNTGNISESPYTYQP